MTQTTKPLTFTAAIDLLLLNYVSPQFVSSYNGDRIVRLQRTGGNINNLIGFSEVLQAPTLDRLAGPMVETAKRMVGTSWKTE